MSCRGKRKSAGTGTKEVEVGQLARDGEVRSEIWDVF